MFIFIDCNTGKVYHVPPNITRQNEAVQKVFGPNTIFKSFDRPKKSVLGEIHMILEANENGIRRTRLIRNLDSVTMINTNSR